MNRYYIDVFTNQYVALLIPLSGTHLKNVLVFIQRNDNIVHFIFVL